MNDLNQPMSGSDIWLGPSEAAPMPECDPTTLTFAPLLIASSRGCVRSVRLLLAKEGIRVNQATHDDATGACGGPFQSVTPLRIAAQHGRLGVVRVLVEQDGIDLDKPGNTDADFESPLQIARRSGYDAVAEVLLAAGAKDDDDTGGGGAAASAEEEK